jgi:hypothetical protein
MLHNGRHTCQYIFFKTCFGVKQSVAAVNPLLRALAVYRAELANPFDPARTAAGAD